ncbi:hypothetical protein DSO57_1031432 [Entomophthora muscae]|uniref:Uncharacterized protein n=1 Tax=Entomophthora muscae TaxID=34485 RepID=A0ACC2SQ00_9FUNG|nr:hypothetical protein DSO57_1031432 [Entomophthora muscae]
MPNSKQPVIVGGGPVGLLTALYLAIRLDADQKPLYPRILVLEKRGDLREENNKESYSKQEYNVVISYRGLQSISGIPGLLEVMMDGGISYSRMQNCIRSDELGKGLVVHTQGDKISIGRNKVVQILLDFIQQNFSSQIAISFGKAVVDIDFKQQKICALPASRARHPFESTQEAEVIDFSALIGTDGSRSIVGEKLRRSVTEISYFCQPHPEPYISARISHEDLKSANIDFHPATMYTVQPRIKGISLISLPNHDSLGVNLVFEHRKNPEDCLFSNLSDSFKLRDFFTNSFPTLGQVLYNSFAMKFGVTDLNTLQQLNIPKNYFLTTKYSQFHHPTSPALILGDAAHTMPPTVGQGINCGFGDVYYLSAVLDQAHDDWSKAPALFNEKRQPEAEAVQKLSQFVLSERGRFVFGLRLGFEVGRSILARRLPSGWIQLPVTQLLSHTNVPYSQVLRARQSQFATGCVVLLSAISSVGYMVFKATKRFWV